MPHKKIIDSKEIRELIINTLESGERGHIGSSLSLVEILISLYKHINFSVKYQKLKNRDRIILSKGHGCITLYCILHKYGLINKSELNKFCKFNSLLGGHPEMNQKKGIEFSTGSLGHGPSVGVGLAKGSKILRKKNNFYIICGDGEINEGSVWESLLSASKHKLENFYLIIDYNKIQSAGFTKDILDLEPLSLKFKAFNFSVEECDGHNQIDILSKLNLLKNQKNKKPKALICHTVKGKGVRFTENNPYWHHKSKIDKFLIKKLKNELYKV